MLPKVVVLERYLRTRAALCISEATPRVGEYLLNLCRTANLRRQRGLERKELGDLKDLTIHDVQPIIRDE